ncbi:efflux RND transporter permease subunit [Paenalcaligenes sp. Me131]|uniref:efflux RND transporter permease subunit n=1 Tax=Paenalcaligenes sp. Me131 TaxID=3392636 RepID=UPI003D2CA479
MNSQLSSWAIRRPIPTLVLFFMLTIAGWLAFLKLPINSNPRVEFPIVTVLVAQPGAAPSELENAITRKVEESVAGMAGVRHITSTLSEGTSLTTVEFNLGVDPDRATNDVRDAITTIRSELPQSILEPQVTRVDVEGGAILYYAISSTERSPEELSWFVDDRVSRVLLAEPGVQRVQRLGGAKREVRVELRPDRLEALGITAEEVNAQLVRSNIDEPGGRAVLSGRELAIRILGSTKEVAELAQLPIALSDGRWAVLSELAVVSDGSAERRSKARLAEREVVGFSVFRSKGASDTVVAELVEKGIQTLQQSHSDIRIQPILSLVKYTEDSYKESMKTLLEGALLTVLVVFVFLRSWRATVVAAIALPLSILPTFVVMMLLDYTLNSITLLALTLVIGILVDDAIVEVENIEQHLYKGKRPYQAAIDAADAIGFAVVAITATIVAVFLPVSFIGGYIGQYFEQFGVTVSVAVLASLLVARLATPLLAAYILQPLPASKLHAANAPAKGLLKRYLSILEWALNHRRRTLGVGALFLVASAMLLAFIPVGFMPEGDQSLINMQVKLPPGATLAQTDAKIVAMSQKVRQHPEVDAVFASSGGDGDDSSGVASGSMMIRLVPLAKRDASQKQVEQRLRSELAQFEDVQFSFGGGESRDVSVILVSADGQALSDAAHRLRKQMEGLKGIANVQVKEPLARPELQIRLRTDESARAGVTAQSVGAALRIATVGDIDASSARFNAADRQVPIRVLLSERDRNDVETLRQLRIPSQQGGTVPLHTVADVGFGVGPAQIERFDRMRRIAVEADLQPGQSLGTVLESVYALPEMQDLPTGVTLMKYGDAEFLTEMFEKFALAMGFGILMVYAVLVLLFKDFLQPLTILVALPLSMGGAFAGLLLQGATLDLSAVIGILMLMGIVTKNSILLVDFASEKHRAGMNLAQALLQSGKERARPIVMTTIAMVAGMIPVLLSTGADAGFRAPMAAAVIGGLLTSTLLSLVFIPVVYSYMDDLRQWLGKHLSKLTSVNDEDRRLADQPFINH